MSWKKIKLSEFLKNRDGRYKPNDISISDFKRIDKIDFSGNIFISDKASNTDMILVKKGDLVISGINIEKGAMTVYEGDNDITATIHYSSYIYDKEKIDIEFLKYFLKSLEFKQAIKEQVPGGIKTEIKPKHLLPLEVFIPTTIEEQKIVVENLKSIEKENLNLATEINTQLKLVKQLRQSFLREAMQGKLTADFRSAHPKLIEGENSAQALLEKIKTEKKQLIKDGKLRKEKELAPISEDEISFEIPENWVWCRLGNSVSNIFDGPFGSHLKSSDYTSSGVQVIRLQNLGVMKFKKEKESFVSFEKYKTIKGHTVYEGDIIIGSFLADGVNCVILPKLDNIAIAKADCFTIRIQHKRLINKYIMYLLSSPLMFMELSKLLRGMTRLRINTTQLKNLPIPLPLLSEQQAIVSKLDELMRTCDELETSIRTSQKQNEMLLQQVLREALGIKTSVNKDKQIKNPNEKIISSKFDSNTLLMKIQELLKIHGKLHAYDLWQMSEFYGKTDDERNIDGFYAELKKLIERDGVVNENEKSYLELV